MYGTSLSMNINSYFKPNISQEISLASKFIQGDFNTELSKRNTNKNYGDFLYRSNKLESFLKSTFNITSDFNSLISFILNNDLFEIIFRLPNLLTQFFETMDFDICLEYDFSNEQWIVISIFTTHNGDVASNQLDILEEKLYEEYGDKFFDNILLTVEFP